MPQKVLVFTEVDPATPEATGLMAELDRDLGARYPGFPIHGIDAANFRAAGGVFLVGRLADSGVACGALRPMEAGAVEVKRMYVRDAHRGHGYGRAMRGALERSPPNAVTGSFVSKPAPASRRPLRFMRARATSLFPA